MTPVRDRTERQVVVEQLLRSLPSLTKCGKESFEAAAGEWGHGSPPASAYRTVGLLSDVSGASSCLINRRSPFPRVLGGLNDEMSSRDSVAEVVVGVRKTTNASRQWNLLRLFQSARFRSLLHFLHRAHEGGCAHGDIMDVHHPTQFRVRINHMLFQLIVYFAL